MATVELERRTLLLVALGLSALAAPILQVNTRMAAGVDRAVEAAGAHCAVARASDGARIDVSALQGAELACRELQRADTGDRWQLTDSSAHERAACTLERRGGTAIAAVARVRGGDSAAVCATLRHDGWLIRGR